MNENVIKMAKLMGGCKDRACEDCFLSQSKKLFGDNKCALIEYAEVLDKAGYRKQRDTVKEFGEKVVDIMIKHAEQHGYDPEGSPYYTIDVAVLQIEMGRLAEQYSKEER